MNNKYFIDDWSLRRIDINDSENLCLRGRLYESDCKTLVKRIWYSDKLDEITLNDDEDKSFVSCKNGDIIELGTPHYNFCKLMSKNGFCICSYCNSDQNTVSDFYRYHPIVFNQDIDVSNLTIVDKHNGSNKWSIVDELCLLLKESLFHHQNDKYNYIYLSEEENFFIKTLLTENVFGKWTRSDDIISYDNIKLCDILGNIVSDN